MKHIFFLKAHHPFHIEQCFGVYVFPYSVGYEQKLCPGMIHDMGDIHGIEI